MRANRMPVNIAISCVPTVRPRCCGGAISTTMEMNTSPTDAHIPVTRLAAASTAMDGAIAISACAMLSTRTIPMISQRLLIRSPSGTSNAMPTSMPPNENVGIQPTAAGLAWNSLAIVASIGV